MGNALDTISCDVKGFQLSDFAKLVEQKTVNVYRFSSHIKIWEIFEDEGIIQVEPLLLTSQSPVSSRRCYVLMHLYWKNRVYPGEDFEDDENIISSTVPKLSLDEYLSAQVTKLSPRGLQNKFSIQTLTELMPNHNTLYDIYLFNGKNTSKLVESNGITFGYNLERTLLRFETHLSNLFNIEEYTQISLSRIFQDDLEEPKRTVIWKRHLLFRFFGGNRETSPSIFSILSLIFPVKEFSPIYGKENNFLQEFNEEEDDDDDDDEISGEEYSDDSEEEEEEEEGEELETKKLPSELSNQLKLDFSSIPKKKKNKKKEKEEEKDLDHHNFEEGVAYSAQELVKMFRSHCSKITDQVFLGGDYVARRREILKKNEISYVVNVAKVACQDYFPQEFEYLSFYLFDHGSQPLLGPLLKTIDIIERNPSEKVYIHCHEGVSRSTSITIGYIMYKKRLCFHDAMEYVKKRRRSASPNAGFIVQLFQWEMILGTGQQLVDDTTTTTIKTQENPNRLERFLLRVSPLGKKRSEDLIIRVCGSQRLDSRTTFILCVKTTTRTTTTTEEKEECVYLWVGKWASAACLKSANEYISLLLKYYFGRNAKVKIVHEIMISEEEKEENNPNNGKKSQMYTELGQMDISELIEEKNYDDLDFLMSEIPSSSHQKNNNKELELLEEEEESGRRIIDFKKMKDSLNNTEEYIKSLELETSTTSSSSSIINDNDNNNKRLLTTTPISKDFGLKLKKISILDSEEEKKEKKNKNLKITTEKEISRIFKKLEKPGRRTTSSSLLLSPDSDDEEYKQLPPIKKRGDRRKKSGKEFYENLRLEADQLSKINTTTIKEEEDNKEEFIDYEEELRKLDEEEKKLLNEEKQQQKQKEEVEKEKEKEEEEEDFSQNEALKILKEFEESNIIDKHFINEEEELSVSSNSSSSDDDDDDSTEEEKEKKDDDGLSFVKNIPTWKLPGIGSSPAFSRKEEEEEEDDDEDVINDDEDINPSVLNELNSLKDIEETLSKLQAEEDNEEEEEEESNSDDDIEQENEENEEEEEDEELKELQDTLNRMKKERMKIEDNNNNNNVVRMSLIDDDNEKRDREVEEEEEDDDDVSSDTPDDGESSSEEEEKEEESKEYEEEGDNNNNNIEELETSSEYNSSSSDDGDEFDNSELFEFPEFNKIKDFYDEDLESKKSFVLIPSKPDFLFVWIGKEFEIDGNESVEDKANKIGELFKLKNKKTIDENAPIIIVCEGEMSNNMDLFKRFFGED